MDFHTLAECASLLGGFELVKWLYRVISNKENNAKINDAEADEADFKVIKSVNTFLQEQLQAKEERFADQTTRLRAAQDERDQIRTKCVELELQLKDAEFHRCNVKGCPKRQPPNEYL